LSELVGLSRFALVGTARRSTCEWEGSGEGRRIVTYTEVEIQQALDGTQAPAGDVLVRTLGGSVGDIGQIVHGEAELKLGVVAVYFLHESMPEAYGITAMTQGHYPLSLDRQGAYRLSPNPNLSEFVLKDAQSAVSRLRGKTLIDCERMIAQERR
jgi:hypothetical protein